MFPKPLLSVFFEPFFKAPIVGSCNDHQEDSEQWH